ncbi:MAG: hypothetical protein IIB44_03795 [Candidatus Marinimicrobia bacterium]|nr:hypothetical protein [Candidatus Neomarinimicrobiota bacterium]
MKNQVPCLPTGRQTLPKGLLWSKNQRTELTDYHPKPSGLVLGFFKVPFPPITKGLQQKK